MKLLEFLKIFLATVNWPTVLVLLLVVIPLVSFSVRRRAAAIRKRLKEEKDEHQTARLKICNLKEEIRGLQAENDKLTQLSAISQMLSDGEAGNDRQDMPSSTSDRMTPAGQEITGADEEVIDLIVVRDFFNDRDDNGMDTIDENPGNQDRQGSDFMSVTDLFEDDSELEDLTGLDRADVTSESAVEDQTTLDTSSSDVVAVDDQSSDEELLEGNDVAKGGEAEFRQSADEEPAEVEDASQHEDEADEELEEVTDQLPPDTRDVESSTSESNQPANDTVEPVKSQSRTADETGSVDLTNEERAILIAISKQRLDGLSSSGIISSQRVQIALNRLMENGLIDEVDEEFVDSPAGRRWLESRASS